MFCEKCGKQLKNNSKFCPGCGTAIVPGTQSSTNLPANNVPFSTKTTYTSSKVKSTKIILLIIMLLEVILTWGVYGFNTIGLIEEDHKIKLSDNEIIEHAIEAFGLTGAVLFAEFGLTIVIAILFIQEIFKLISKNSNYDCTSKLSTISIVLLFSNFFRYLYVLAYRKFILNRYSELFDDEELLKEVKESIRDAIKPTPSVIICIILSIVLIVALHYIKIYIVRNKIDGDKYSY